MLVQNHTAPPPLPRPGAGGLERGGAGVSSICLAAASSSPSVSCAGGRRAGSAAPVGSAPRGIWASPGNNESAGRSHTAGWKGRGGEKNKYKSSGGECVRGGDGAAERGSGVVNSRAGGGEREQSRDHPHLFPPPPRVLRARSGEAEEEEEEEEEEAVRCHPCGCGALPGGRRGRRGVQWGCVSPPHPR